MKPVILTYTCSTDLEQQLTQLLSGTTYEPVLTRSLRAAAQYLQMNFMPEVIVLDWALHDVGAADFLRKMRAERRFASLPVLVVVSEPDPEAIRAAFQAGANRYITQSFISSNLLRTIREMKVAAV